MASHDLILTVKGLNVSFNSHKVLDNISFELKRDDTLAVIGPNGAGKTVLFKCLLGLLPYTGEVKWAKDAAIGYVPQRLNVGEDLPLTVEEFLHFKEKDAKKLSRILKQVGFEEDGKDVMRKGGRLFSTKLGVLSGGEFQRVLIAFALLGKRNVLLFDEPTSGVDVSAEQTVYSLIEDLKKETNLTILFISHELQVVYKHAVSVLCLNRQKVCFGPPREVIDKESLQKMYGEDVHFHHHSDHY